MKKYLLLISGLGLMNWMFALASYPSNALAQEEVNEKFVNIGLIGISNLYILPVATSANTSRTSISRRPNPNPRRSASLGTRRPEPSPTRSIAPRPSAARRRSTSRNARANLFSRRLQAADLQPADLQAAHHRGHLSRHSCRCFAARPIAARHHSDQRPRRV